MKNKYLENLKKGKELNELRLTKIKKRIEVKLSKLDDIEEAIDRGAGLLEFVEEAIDKAQIEFVKAKDIVRFDMTAAYNDAEFELKELLQSYITSIVDWFIFGLLILSNSFLLVCKSLVSCSTFSCKPFTVASNSSLLFSILFNLFILSFFVRIYFVISTTLLLL